MTDDRMHKTAGIHLVAEYTQCDSGILDDESAVESLLVRAAESVGETVVSRVFHKFRPSGVTGCVILSNSHLTIHTWPPSRYASIDFYTSHDCDPYAVNAVLKSGLQTESSEIFVIERGRGGTNRMKLQGHRPVASYTLNCRGSRLPDGILVARSAKRGLGLFANRDFSDGELIYETPGRLVEWDAEFTLQTDVEKSFHNADSLGYELTPPFVADLPKQIHDAICEHFELQNPKPAVMLQHLTDDYDHEVLITEFDGLKNHADRPNTIMDWPDATLEFQDDEEDGSSPVFSIPTLALGDIRAGDELFVDYRVSLPDFVPPADWIL